MYLTSGNPSIPGALDFSEYQDGELESIQRTNRQARVWAATSLLQHLQWARSEGFQLHSAARIYAGEPKLILSRKCMKLGYRKVEELLKLTMTDVPLSLETEQDFGAVMLNDCIYIWCVQHDAETDDLPLLQRVLHIWRADELEVAGTGPDQIASI